MKVLVLTGPTGVGKTEIAAELALRNDLDLVSADSRQVYDWLNVGTAKPDRALRSRLAVHMVDMVDPRLSYSAADYARDALAVMRRLERAGRRFVLVGGSGLYIRAVFEPLFETPKPTPGIRNRLKRQPTAQLYECLKRADPERASELNPHDRQRIVRSLEVYEQTGQPISKLRRRSAPPPEFRPRYVVLTRPKPVLYARIDRRFEQMLEQGLLDEVRQLRAAGIKRDSRVLNAYGYSELMAHLEGTMTLADAVARSKAKTRAYARRQLTWLRALPDAQWVEYTNQSEVIAELEKVLEETGGTLSATS
ncbi:MAG: tRNA (adenosine(37)-N6)-dimethylallyltransferase MiaA [candidate division WOR-3 bacterium]|nr:MAG: tRNA (adenosine(37)-N6)-dimethylallyltransferase MiaA [candidate division WOR-3 bacterium]